MTDINSFTKLYKDEIILLNKNDLIRKLIQYNKTGNLNGDIEDFDRLIKLFEKNDFDAENMVEFHYIMKLQNDDLSEYIQLFEGLEGNNESVVFAKKKFILDIFRKNKKKLDEVLTLIALKYETGKLIKMNKLKIEIISELTELFKTYKVDTTLTLEDCREEYDADFFINSIEKPICEMIIKKTKLNRNYNWVYSDVIEFVISDLIHNYPNEYQKISKELIGNIEKLIPKKNEVIINENINFGY
jgi:hypothetical protein